MTGTKRLSAWWRIAAAAGIVAAVGPLLAAHAQETPEEAEQRLPLLRTPLSPLAPADIPFGTAVELPYAGDEQRLQEAVETGESLFASMNCDGCHASLGGGGMGPALSNDFWIYGGSAGNIYMSIVQGRPAGMPAFGGLLTEDAAWALVAYIQTLNERKESLREAAGPQD